MIRYLLWATCDFIMSKLLYSRHMDILPCSLAYLVHIISVIEQYVSGSEDTVGVSKNEDS